MENAIRNHKDNVFCMIYRDRKNLMSLYNALNGTDYGNEEELEVVTLSESICMKMKNDAAFIVDHNMNLYEQQSSVNPNMPLRDLYYITTELKSLVRGEALYREAPVLLPTPRFVVFYNGRKRQPARKVYRLSDLFEKPEGNPQLELEVTMININPGNNDELLEKCESLKGYMEFVNRVRRKQDGGIKTEDAVVQSVDECMNEGILSEFLRKYREEVIDMGIWEYDAELHEKALREDGMAEGEKLKLLKMISKKVNKGKTVEEIADDLEESIEDILPFYEAVMQCGDDNAEEAYKWLQGKKMEMV